MKFRVGILEDMFPKAWHKQGTDPDYRFTLANERTFLAWVRTNLALLATIIVFDHLAESSAYSGLLRALCLGLLLVAGVLALGSYFKWRANEIAMRHARSLPVSLFQPLVGFAILIVTLTFAAFVTGK